MPSPARPPRGVFAVLPWCHSNTPRTRAPNTLTVLFATGCWRNGAAPGRAILRPTLGDGWALASSGSNPDAASSPILEATIATFAFFLLEPRPTAHGEGIRVGLVVFAPLVSAQILKLAGRRVRVALRVAVVVLAIFVALVGGICRARDGEHERGR